MSALITETVDHEARWAYDVLDTLARARLHEAKAAAGETGPVDDSVVSATTPDPETERDGATPQTWPRVNGTGDTDAASGVDNSVVPATTPTPAPTPEVTATNGRASLPLLRKQVLFDLLTAAAAAPDFPTQHGKRRIETQVVIDLPTLLGLRENPAAINGVPVPAPIARELAAHTSTLRRLVTDEVNGQLLEVGTGYTPPQAMTEFLLVRDHTCRVPGCGTRAVATDLDHAQEYSAGGQTTTGNLGALCRSHHTLKTARHTDITDSNPDGSATYITVLGQQIPIPPRPVLPNDDNPAA